MTIKPLYPSVRPSLDLNFAATKRLDPRISYSRASAGTYFGADGLLKSAAVNEARFDHNPITGESLGLLVEEARTNYALYSEQNIGWAPAWAITVPNVITAPDGTQTGSLLADDSSTSTHSIGRGFTNNQSTITFSAYVKRGSARYFAIGAKTTSPNASACFDFDNPSTITHQAGSISTFYSASLTLVGNGWYRVVVSHSGMGGGSGSLYLFTLNSQPASNGGMNDFNYLSYTGTSSLNIYWWGFQVEYGGFPTSYIPTPATFTGRSSTATFYDSAGVIQTALSGVARSNAYFPDSSGVFRSAGLLLEAAATNLLTRSQEFDTSPWSTAGMGGVVTANTDTAPDGTLTADRISDKRIERYDISYTANTTYTFSLFVKGTAGQSLGIGRLIAGSDGDAILSYTTLTGTWQRLSYTFTSPITASNSRVVISGANDKAGTATNFLVWGAQLETGSYPTSYIPTTTATATRAADTSTSSAVTRAADVAVLSGANFSSWWNPLAGTFQAHFRAGLSGTRPVLSVDDNTANNRIELFTTGSSQKMVVTAGGVAQADLTAGTASGTAINRQAAAYALNDFSTVLASATPVTDTSGTVPTVTQLRIGADQAGNTRTAPIVRLTYWPTRLSNATLQAITH